MVEKPVKDKDPVMGSTFTGHVWKRAWMTSVITSWRDFCLSGRVIKTGKIMTITGFMALAALFYSYIENKQGSEEDKEKYKERLYQNTTQRELYFFMIVLLGIAELVIKLFL